VALDVSRSLLAGINIAGVSTNAPDTLALYDITDLSAPLLIATYNFPSNALPNKNMVGQVLFAGNRVYALDGNNGIVAFSIVAPAKPELNVGLSGSDVILSWPNSFSGYTLYSASVVTGPFTNPEGAGTAIGNYYWVTNTLSGTQKYYRLQK
jgi:hypothetical protein